MSDKKKLSIFKEVEIDVESVKKMFSELSIEEAIEVWGHLDDHQGHINNTIQIAEYFIITLKEYFNMYPEHMGELPDSLKPLIFNDLKEKEWSIFLQVMSKLNTRI